MCRSSAEHAAFSRDTFRNSVKVRCTRSDKHSAQYAVLISAAAACLLHSIFDAYRNLIHTCGVPEPDRDLVGSASTVDAKLAHAAT